MSQTPSTPSARAPGQPDPRPLAPLAAELGVSIETLERLGVTPHGGEWHIPERDAEGVIIGTGRRLHDGKKNFVEGGKRGLILGWPLDASAGSAPTCPVIVVEGMSDTAAGMTLGFDTVGRYNATGGGAMLADLLRGRHVCIVGENDGKGADDPKRPGKLGAEATANALVAVCPSVRIIYPPADAKDLRTWLTSPAPPDKAEVEAAISAVDAWPPAVEEASPDKTGPVLVCMANVEPRAINWLWQGRISLGRLSLLVGRPGEGKSFLTTDMAARVTTGTPWPDGSPCGEGSVILITAEDDPRDTIRPRLDAHHANLLRVHHMNTEWRVGKDGNRQEVLFSLADVEDLEKALRQHRDCKLIIIDPIGSFLGGQTDAHRDNEVRSVLAPAAMLAERYGPAVLVVAHRRKSGGSFADDTALGSRAFTGIARAVWHLSREKENISRRLLLPGKNNLAPEGHGLAFSIAGEPAALCWERDPVTMSADDALAVENGDRDAEGAKPGPAPVARDSAAEWLRKLLDNGPMEAAAIKTDATVAGYAWRTMHRAKDDLGVLPYKREFSGGWWWRLPDAPTCHTPEEQENMASWHIGKNTGKSDASEHGRIAGCQDDFSWHLGKKAPRVTPDGWAEEGEL